MAAALVAQPEGTSGVGQRQIEAGRLRLQPGHQPAQQPGGRGSEDAEPELLDVEGSRVESKGVDDIVVPGTDGEGVGRKGGDSRHEMASGERGGRTRGSNS